ncbi:MAG: S9 family peptidase [Saprospiraceae bacterium]|nr:S9 family peptidase [Saprospiraceae bacterium]MDW8483836.1 S9 family peptidase [Saprospiraceae bacterium]
MQKIFGICLFWSLAVVLVAQNIRWTPEGDSYWEYEEERGQIVKVTLPERKREVVVTSQQLTQPGALAPMSIRDFSFSEDGTKVLLYTNAKRVWRYDTRGDYWVFDIKKGELRQLGKDRPSSSLMFAKFSPDGQKVAYVSERNIYVEDLNTGKVTQLTQSDARSKLINGTFDWVYEEEFDCRDGFRWSPDSRKIAYWQIDANRVREFYLINNIDSVYSIIIPIEYPKVGEPPSPYRIGVVDVATAQTRWMDIPGDPTNTYLPRMEWAANSSELLLQQLNRKQNTSQLLLCSVVTGKAQVIYTETDEAWIDLKASGEKGYWDWLEGGRSFLWISEKDGWRHAYRVSRDGKSETLLTPGNYDILRITRIDEKGGYLYFTASPYNATQEYLYRIRMDGKSQPERLSPSGQVGTHHYAISPNARYALHIFSNHYTPRMEEWITLPEHKPLDPKEAIPLEIHPPSDKKMDFFQVTTEDSVVLDGWMIKPADFDSTKRYPIVFYVYTEPAGTTVRDQFGVGRNRLYLGDMSKDGYIYASLDGRGTPAPKGRAWRKAIYRKIGILNIRDQAMGAKAMFRRWPWIDTSRVAVHGWSGGGAATLNLLFQYPDIYHTGIAIAAITNQLTYDNIYQERYMGLPQENREDFIAGSPVTYAKNLRGNLLYIHGTADDNVHYQNAEILINELIKHNKQFQFMAYPNRSHSLSEGEGTSRHLATLFTNFLRTHCPPGGR